MLVLLLPLVAAILLFYPRWQQRHCPAEEQEYAFVIRSAPHETAKCHRFEAEAPGTGTVWLYLWRDSTRHEALPQYGDTIVARTTIRTNRSIRSAFAARYLLFPAATHDIPLQARLYQRLEAAGLRGDELATTGALTLGYKEDLDNELKHRFQASGAAHVLAVSGLHTGILYALLLGLLTLGGRLKPRYENRLGRCLLSLIIIAVMWAYAWLTGLTPSVVRAVLMVTLVEIGRMLYRQSLSLNTIAAAAVLILLVRPSDLYSISFQLSFAATAAIVLVAKEFERTIHRQNWKDTFLGKVLNWVLGTIIISLAAQLGTLPITMHAFGQVSNYFLLTNLFVMPLAALLVPFGLVTIALGGSWLGILVGKGTYALAWLMNHAVGWIEHLPGSTTRVYIDGWQMLILYAAMCTGWLALHPANKKRPGRALWWLVPTAVLAALFCFRFAKA